MNFTIKGKIIDILPEITGTSARGEWKKRTFVIETDGEQYPKKIALELFNKTLDFGLNAQVEVGFSVESNEYQGKYYTSAKAFKIELIGVAPQQSSVTQKPANEPPASSDMDKPEEGDGENLPF